MFLQALHVGTFLHGRPLSRMHYKTGAAVESHPPLLTAGRTRCSGAVRASGEWGRVSR